MRKLLTVAAVVLTWGIASNAAAQRGGGNVDREGFLIGFSVGGGSMSCGGCQSKAGPAVSFQIGSMVTDKLAVMLDATGMAISESDIDFGDVTTSNGVSTIALQYWVVDRFWIKGGVGIGTTRVSFSGGDAASDSGLGLMGAAGYELVQKGKFALDLQGRFATTKHSDGHINQLTVSVGFNWY
jgi:hypothetical protein